MDIPDRSGEARVGVRGHSRLADLPLLSHPRGHVLVMVHLVLAALPVDVARGGRGHVREESVVLSKH